MQICTGDKSLLRPSKWVQRGPKPKWPPPCSIYNSSSLVTRPVIKTCGNTLPRVNNLSLTSQKEPGMSGEGIMTRGGKLTFSYFPPVCPRKDVSWREGKLRQCLSSFITLITVAPQLCPAAFPHRTIFTTPVICAPVILPPLTGTVNRACLSSWLGLGLGLEPELRQGAESELGWMAREEASRGGS